jgi:hypothetical protein
LNKTIRKQIGIFIITAALNLLTVVLQPMCLWIKGDFAPGSIIIAEAWAEPASRVLSETTPTRHGEKTQQPLVQGSTPVSSPSTTSPPEGQKKPATGPVLLKGEESLPQLPQVQGSSPVSPSTTAPEGPRKPATGPVLLKGEESLPQLPQVQGSAPVSSPTTTAHGFFDVLHEDISGGILATANWLDSFFGDKRFDTEVNKSYVRVGYNAFMEQGSPAQIKPDFAVRIALPQLRQRTHLLIWGSPKEEDENQFSASQTHSTKDQLATTDQRNITAALQIAPHETVDSSFFLGGGAKFSTTGVAWTGGPRYRFTVPFESGWTLRFVEDLAWRTDGPWQSRGTVDLERPLPHNLFFRTSAERIDTERVDGYVYSLGFNVRQPLGSRRALEYEWVNIFQSSPVDELIEVDFRISYRKRIWRDWLYYTVMPQYRFPRNRNFEATPGILFRLEMTLGSYT